MQERCGIMSPFMCVAPARSASANAQHLRFSVRGSGRIHSCWRLTTELFSEPGPSLSAAEAAGAAFAASAGCADPSTAAACLRSLPVAAILAHQPAGTMVPNLDGLVLPQTIRSAFTTGQFNRVPVIEGSNHDEWRLFVAQTEATTGTPLTPAGYIPAIAATLGVPASTATFIGTVVYPLNAYPSPSVALGAIGTDVVFACNARLSARLLSKYVPTYQYEFNDPSAPMLFFPSISFPTGAYHASELQYIFDVLETPVPSPGLTAVQKQLSRTMVGYWAEFARTGSPNSSEAPAWPPYGSSDQFQSLHPPTPAASTGFALDHKCAFWGLN
jgi:para-nitrobenzyl esterase